jgi:hypothetical protein
LNSGLHFNPDGLQGIQMFLASHAPTVRALSLHGLEKTNLESLLQSFHASHTLEHLDLSHNELDASTCRNLQHYTLKHLILEHVQIDTAAVQELSQNCNSLEDLQVSPLHPLGADGFAAACNLIQGNKKLTSLKWVYKHGAHKAKLPWNAVQVLAKEHSLTHLVMEGARLQDREVDQVCRILQELPALKTLKLRKLALGNTAVTNIAAALRETKPPLVCLDLSFNAIEAEGARAICQLCELPLKVLAMAQNKIDAQSFIQIVEAFRDIEIHLEHNAFDPYQVALECMQSKVRNDKEIEKLGSDRDRLQAESLQTQEKLAQVMEEQEQIASDLRALQEENKRLQDERDTLAKAFSIVGVAQQVKENRKLLDRIAYLEDVVGQRSDSLPPSYNTSPVSVVAKVETAASPSPSRFTTPVMKRHSLNLSRVTRTSKTSSGFIGRNRSFDDSHSLDQGVSAIVSTSMAPSSPIRTVRRTVSSDGSRSSSRPPFSPNVRFHNSASAIDFW